MKEEVITGLTQALPWIGAVVSLKQLPRIINAWTLHRLSMRLAKDSEKKLPDKRFRALARLARDMYRNRLAGSRASRTGRIQNDPASPE